MTTEAKLPADISSNPAWLIHDFQPILRRFAVFPVEESLYRDTSFMNHALEAQIRNVFPVELAALHGMFAARPGNQKPAPYIFHIGHCGSTLVSRALGAVREVLPVREPQLLNVLSDCRRELDDPLGWLSPPEYQAFEHIALLAMERRFHSGQVPVIKVTSTSNNLASSVLGQNPARKALLLFQPLESALAGALRTQHKANSDLRTQARLRLRDWHEVTGQYAPPLSGLRPEQMAVISWLGNVARLKQAMTQYPERILAQDFEKFLADPAAHLARICSHFDLDHVQQSVIDAYPEVSRNYSKNPELGFTAADRQAILNKSRQRFQSQLKAGLQYARSLLAEHEPLTAVTEFIE